MVYLSHCCPCALVHCIVCSAKKGSSEKLPKTGDFAKMAKFFQIW